jgi:hypothetical protein
METICLLREIAAAGSSIAVVASRVGRGGLGGPCALENNDFAVTADIVI